MFVAKANIDTGIVNDLHKMIFGFVSKHGKLPKGIILGAQDTLELWAELQDVLKFEHVGRLDKPIEFEGVPIIVSDAVRERRFRIDPNDAPMFTLVEVREDAKGGEG